MPNRPRFEINDVVVIDPNNREKIINASKGFVAMFGWGPFIVTAVDPFESFSATMLDGRPLCYETRRRYSFTGNLIECSTAAFSKDEFLTAVHKAKCQIQKSHS